MLIDTIKIITIDYCVINKAQYIGRFAPSPTGVLHVGSLIAALASYLDARHQKGLWLIRIDDLDLQRCRNEYSVSILHSLENFGLFWDGEVMYQSQRTKFYAEVIEQLKSAHMTYACYCSRQEIPENQPYPGTCSALDIKNDLPHSIRIRTSSIPCSFTDRLQGYFEQRLDKEIGDFNICRRDGFHSYHLATVVDDYYQGINQVVRGSDLISSTLRQIYLQTLLDYPNPEYLHFPIAVDSTGNKISKQNHAPDITLQNNRLEVIKTALEFLGQSLPTDYEYASTHELIDWACKHWCTEHIPNTAKISINETNRPYIKN